MKYILVFKPFIVVGAILTIMSGCTNDGGTLALGCVIALVLIGDEHYKNAELRAYNKQRAAFYAKYGRRPTKKELPEPKY